MGARERVLRVLKAAARFRDERDLLHREVLEKLPQEIGWSEASVLDALRYCVETQASEDELMALLASVPQERLVHVVLSSNVFVAAVRAVALAWASAPQIRIKPSRRERLFPSLLIRALHEQGGEGEVSLVDALDVREDEAVHVYGSDSTIEVIRAELPLGARLWGHGHGFGVLVSDAPLPEDSLAADLNLLEQRGCLSPRVLLWVGNEDDARAQASQIPRLFTDRSAGDLAARRSYIETMQAVGEVFQRGPFAVGFQSEPDALLLPPEPGMLHVVQVSSVTRACELLLPWARWVTCVGGPVTLTRQFSQVIPKARRATPGFMQRPSLNGPVDLRTQAPIPGYSPAS